MEDGSDQVCITMHTSYHLACLIWMQGLTDVNALPRLESRGEFGFGVLESSQVTKMNDAFEGCMGGRGLVSGCMPQISFRA